MIIKNKETGRFEKMYTEKDEKMFKDWIKSGTTYKSFTQNVMRLFDISAATATTWYYRIKKSLD